MPFLERTGKPTLHYEIDDFTDPWRNAPVLILQHGFGRSSKFWTGWVPYLSRFYKVVRPDIRGLGQSATNFDLDKDLNVGVLIDDLVAIIDNLGAESVHYCGESLGGILGVLLAAEHPGRIRTLNLVSTPVYNNPKTKKTFTFGHASWDDALRKMGVKAWAEAANASYRFAPDADPRMLQWHAEEMGKSDVEVLIALSRMCEPVNVTPYLSRIKAPVLALYPSLGLITSQEQEDLLRAHIPNIRFIRLATPYHMIQHIHPALCAKNVLYFASQHDGVSCHE